MAAGSFSPQDFRRIYTTRWSDNLSPSRPQVLTSPSAFSKARAHSPEPRHLPAEFGCVSAHPSPSCSHPIGSLVLQSPHVLVCCSLNKLIFSSLSSHVSVICRALIGEPRRQERKRFFLPLTRVEHPHQCLGDPPGDPDG